MTTVFAISVLFFGENDYDQVLGAVQAICSTREAAIIQAKEAIANAWGGDYAEDIIWDISYANDTTFLVAQLEPDADDSDCCFARVVPFELS